MNISASRLAWLRLLLVLGTCIALMYGWMSRANDFPIVQPDAYENLTAAYNLAHHGTISLDAHPQGTPRPSEYREPLPIAALALYIAAVRGETTLGELVESQNARLLKHSNLPWGALLAVVVFATIVRCTGSYGWAAFGTLVTDYGLAEHYNGLYSEVAAAALLALACAMAAYAVHRRQGVWFLLTGLLFGALTLTKAAFLYVSIVLVLMLAALGVWRAVRGQPRDTLRAALLVALGLAIVVGPWLLRNHLQFDRATMSSRGGQVLLTRAVKNGMTAEEYRGAWFAYAPRPLRWVASQLTGFDKRDLVDDGRLERLVRYADLRDRTAPDQGLPDEAVSYFAKVKAMRTQLEMTQTEVDPVAVDRELKRRAFALIKADPWAHLATTPLFLWRGAPYTFCILLAGAFYAVARRRDWLLAYIAPALALVAFYALLTHFIPRYGDPLRPVAAVVFAVLMHAAWCAALAWLRTRRSAHRGAASHAYALRETHMTEPSR